MKAGLTDEDRHVIDMSTEVQPLVAPAWDLITLTTSMAKQHLKI